MARPRPAPPMPARDAYRRWAAHYESETVISAIEERGVSRISPPSTGRRLLDAGCGTGRRLAPAAAGADRAVGVDLVPEMLLAGTGAVPTGRLELAAGDLCALPLRDSLFDLIWCRLVIGHVADCAAAFAELARVSLAGAELVLTDFHPAAVAAGHVRSFRDADGVRHTIEHHARTEAEQRMAATAAGWTVVGAHHLTPGPHERAYYERAGRLADYRAHRDLPLVLVLYLRC